MAQLESMWPFILALVAGIVWSVRVEANAKADSKRLDALEKAFVIMQEKHDGLDDKIVGELTRIRESLARLEGRLAGRDDINS